MSGPKCTQPLPTELWRIIIRLSLLCWHLPIFTPRRQGTIVGTTGLNFRVRYGNGWTPYVINTNYLVTRAGIEPALPA